MSDSPTTSSSWFDRVITSIADPNYQENMDNWAANEKNLEAKRQELLNSGKLTTPQAEKLASADYSYQDEATGNAKLFKDTAIEEGSSIISGTFNGIGSFIWKSLPWWVWLGIALGAVFYFWPVLSRFIPAKK